MNENIEIWRDVIGYEGSYQVSNLGRLKSLTRKMFGSNKIVKGKFIRPSNNKGYLYVVLRKNGLPSTFVVHILAAKAFIPNPLNLPEVNHKNLVKSDNRVENLEWNTKQDNMDHAKRNGVIERGEDASLAKLKWTEIKEIRKSYFEDINAKQRTLGEKYNVRGQNISSILQNKTWFDAEYQKLIDSGAYNRLVEEKKRHRV
jgi:hypothetical protein